METCSKVYCVAIIFLIFSPISNSELQYSLSALEKFQNHGIENVEINLGAISVVCPLCFVSVTSYGRIYFQPTVTPILLRRIAPLIGIDYSTRRFFLVEYLHEHSGKLVNSTLHVTKGYILDPCISNYYYQQLGVRYGSYCSKVLKDNFTTSSRPWNYEFHVVFHPPIFETNKDAVEKRIVFHEFATIWWQDPWETRKIEYGIVMLIVRNDTVKDVSKIREYLQSITNTTIKLLNGTLTRHPIYTTVNLIDWNFNGTLSSFLICPPCSQRSYEGAFVTHKQQHQHVVAIIKNMLLHQANISNWCLLLSSNGKISLKRSTEYWELVGNSMRKKLPKDYSKFLIRTKLFELWTRIWSPNFIFKLAEKSNRPSCVVNVLKLGQYSTTSSSFNYQASRIRFLGCGETKQLNFFYESMFSAFDGITWSLLIILSFLVLPFMIVMLGLPNSKRLVDFIVAQVILIKVVLEQSTPFLNKETKTIKQKLFAGVVLLGFCVICNEYKNGKIADVVSPEQFFRFSRFQQLVEANYSIYTELDTQEKSLEFSMTHNPNRSSFIEGNHILNIYIRQLSATISWYWTFTSPVDTQSIIQDFSLKPQTVRDNGIWGNTSIMKESLDHVKQVAAKHISEDLVVKEIEKLQEVASISRLRLCNKIAVVLYEPQIWKYENLLRLSGIAKVSVGKETLIESRLGLTWEAWMPPFILMRLRSLESTGIVDWWNDLATVYLPKVRTRLELNEAELSELELERQTNKLKETSSRFFIIVQLLIHGGVIAGACFCVEIGWQYFKPIGKILSLLKRKFIDCRCHNKLAKSKRRAKIYNKQVKYMWRHRS